MVAFPSLPQAGLAYGADASRYGHPQVAAVAVGQQRGIQRQGYFLDFLMVSHGEPKCGLTIKIKTVLHNYQFSLIQLHSR